MAENKTQPTAIKAEDFLKSITDKLKQQDAMALLKLMKEATKDKPVMWGPAIVGFGKHHYKYDSGREGDTVKVGFSPRKQNFAVYLMGGIKQFPALLKKLGKHKVGGGCLYINKLEDVDQKVLVELISKSYNQLKD